MKLKIINEAVIEGWHVSIHGVTQFDSSRPVLFWDSKDKADKYRSHMGYDGEKFDSSKRKTIHVKLVYHNPLSVNKIQTYYNNPNFLTEKGYDAAIDNNGAILIVNPDKQVEIIDIY